MGRLPTNGAPSFRFKATEVAEMERVLHAYNEDLPAQAVLVALAEKFSETPDRKAKTVVQTKQVWNWFQNRRHKRAKASKASLNLNISPMQQDDSTPVPKITAAPSSASAAPSGAERTDSDYSAMEFEAKSGKDGAWYDVSTFLSRRKLENGDPEVLIQFAKFGPNEAEWVDIKQKHVRLRSIPCESSECIAVRPGDLILCFQEAKYHALYFDAHVLGVQRRRHDIRGCRCRFLVRYEHDQSEEFVPLRKVCRRPETEYRVQKLNALNGQVPRSQQKTSVDPSGGSNGEIIHTEAETMHTAAIPKVTSVSHTNVHAVVETSTPKPKDMGSSTSVTES